MPKRIETKVTYVQVGSVYVLSSDDIGMIDTAFGISQSGEDWFWELLECRKISFPNACWSSQEGKGDPRKLSQIGQF